MNNIRNCSRLITRFQKLSLTNYVSHRCIRRNVMPFLVEMTARKKGLEFKENKQKVPNPRNTYLDWNRDAEMFAFNNRLSEKFDMDLLQQAFTQRSYIIQEEEEQKKVGIEEPILDIIDNLELVEEGEEITEMVIDSYLSQVLPLAPQDCIYSLKKYLLSKDNLAKTSSGIGTTDLILSAEYPIDQETLANTFYALVSALKRSVDLEHAGTFVRDILIAPLAEKDLMEIWTPENPMDILNEILSRENRLPADPRIINQAGVNTLLPVYQVGIYSNKEFLGSGVGETVDEAKDMAALDVLMRMFGLLDSSKPIRPNLKIKFEASNNMSLNEWSRVKIKN